MDNHESFEGVSKLTGIFGHPVNNGFVLGVLTPTFMVSISKGKNIFLTTYYVSVIIVSIIACFLLQQRAAFFLLIMSILYHFIKTNEKLF